MRCSPFSIQAGDFELDLADPPDRNFERADLEPFVVEFFYMQVPKVHVVEFDGVFAACDDGVKSRPAGAARTKAGF